MADYPVGNVDHGYAILKNYIFDLFSVQPDFCGTNWPNRLSTFSLSLSTYSYYGYDVSVLVVREQCSVTKTFAGFSSSTTRRFSSIYIRIYLRVSRYA